MWYVHPMVLRWGMYTLWSSGGYMHLRTVLGGYMHLRTVLGGYVHPMVLRWVCPPYGPQVGYAHQGGLKWDMRIREV